MPARNFSWGGTRVQRLTYLNVRALPNWEPTTMPAAIPPHIIRSGQVLPLRGASG